MVDGTSSKGGLGFVSNLSDPLGLPKTCGAIIQLDRWIDHGPIAMHIA